MNRRPTDFTGSTLVRFGRGLVAAAVASVMVWALCLPVTAHPVAQGALEVTIKPDQAELTVRVTEEELLVSFAHAPEAEKDALAHHGRYLLRHLQVSQDGEPLAGSLVSATTTPGSALPATYRLTFPIAGRGPLTLRQDVLREFEFAPGNPWEASYVVRVTRDGREIASSPLLTAAEPLVIASVDAAVPTSAVESSGVFASYFRHGWHHILGGYDHLLFMCALVLASRRAWQLAQVVTAFTAAHTLTIVLAVKGWVHLPSAVVEPMIAASIVVAALLTVVRPQSISGRSQLAVAFGFGLFHGLGFAGGLLDALQAQPGAAVTTAISGFALGVEAGHQLVALPLFGLLVLARRWSDSVVVRQRFFSPAVRCASACVSLAGVFYLAAALKAPHP